MFLLPFLIIVFNLFIILYPKEVIGASKEGISLWFNNVFPSILPFLIGTNLLISLGVVHFLGTLLEPVMRPLFNVPGVGGFAFVIGITSGYPVGAKVTSSLYLNGDLTKEEAQRLLSFTNNSGPLFMLGAVAIGMFDSVVSGYFIMLIHYLGAITTGLLFRFYKYDPSIINKKTTSSQNILKKAFLNQKKARLNDTRKFGALLGEAVRDSMDIIAQIGGFIILFCVLVKIINIVEINTLFKNLISPVGNKLGIDNSIYDGIFIGIFEITNGAKLLSQNSNLSFYSVLAAAGIIAWGGLSIHAQTISILSKTDLKISIYLFSKILHSFFTICYGILLFPLFKENIVKLSPVANFFHNNIFDKLIFSSVEFTASLIFIFIIALVCQLILIRLRSGRN